MWRLQEHDRIRYNLEVDSTLAQLKASDKVLETIDPDKLQFEVRSIIPSYPIVVVPGAFTQEYPDHDARGQRIIHAAKSIGLDAETIGLPSFCSPQTGGECIAKWLGQSDKRDIILVSLSKGSADTASFFSSPQHYALRKQIRAWVSIGGLLYGTPIINTICANPMLRLYISTLLRLKGYRFKDLKTLMWHRTMAPPWNDYDLPIVPMLHVQSIPRYEHLSCPLAIRAVKRALSYGVSDGGGILLSDLLRYKEPLLLVEKRDHYFKDLPIQALLHRILFWINHLSQ
jgi:hypothetical protein